MRIGPAGDLAGGEDAGRAGFQIGVDHHPAVDLEPGRFRQLYARSNPDAENDEIGG